MRKRLTYMFLLAALAWLAPLTAVHSETISATPALAAHESLPASELPSLLEEERPEEERWSELERQVVSLRVGTAPAASAARFADAPPVALPVEAPLASSAAPRGPPAF